ncbi:hypothetical protein LDENG_00154890, partial [Lucifuga dentata]
MLVVMGTILITVLLCCLAKELMSQNIDIFPAKILVPQNTINENSDLYVICSTFGFKKQPEMVYVYLCKDDLGIKKMIQKEHTTDTGFTVFKVGMKHNGNYSCVYSRKNYLPSNVNKRGDNIIPIRVTANFLPADISVSGAPTVNEGDDIKFRCTVSDTLQTHCESQLIHSYLRKNETILQVQPFNVARMEANFTIKGAVLRDSGHYSCVILPSKCVYEQEGKLHGNNGVFLVVKGEGSRDLVCRNTI